MKKLFTRCALCVLILYMMALPVAAATALIPGGSVIGLELQNGAVTVAGFSDGSPAKAAGLLEGDQILTVDGKTVGGAADVRQALDHSKGSVTLTVRREGKEQTLRLSPTITADGPKLGVYLKDGITGIGTVTFYDPESGSFGALGHGVNTTDGKLLVLKSGSIYGARVASVRKGEAGKPGQLMGAVTGADTIGSLERNTACGVFGKCRLPQNAEAIPVAQPEEVHPGEACIRSTVDDGGIREYSVEIVKIYSGKRGEGRNMLLRVTDETLLQTTGGIVQGMSGSPIIQDGKLVGAVTHVLVNDPTMGYGIFIENMLDAAA